MGLTTYGKYEIEDQVNFTVYVPKVDEHFVGSLAVIPLQLLGYYVSVAKGLDVDKPHRIIVLNMNPSRKLYLKDQNVECETLEN